MKEAGSRGEEIKEIDLKEVVAFFWNKKLNLTMTSLVFAVVFALYSLSLPNKHESFALLVPKVESQSSSVGGLAGQLGGVASLAGINLSGGSELTRAQVAKAKILTLDFFSKYLYMKILPELMAFDSWSATTNEIIYDVDMYDVGRKAWTVSSDNGASLKPTVQKAYQVFRPMVSIIEDLDTGILRLSVSHQSPHVSALWVELMLAGINEELRSKDISEAQDSVEFLKKQSEKTNIVAIEEVFGQLIEEQMKIIMLANVSKDYVFDVIEYPVVSEEKSSPNRTRITLLGALIGFVLACGFVSFRRYLNLES